MTDLVVRGATIRTMDPDCPVASALAATGGQITYVGSDQGVTSLVAPGTTVLDLAGKTVTPGLIDTHIHLVKIGLALRKIVPDGVRSVLDVLGLIRRADVSGEWVWVFGDDHALDLGLLEERRLPVRSELDSACPNRPVVVEAGPDLVALNSAACDRVRSLGLEPDADGLVSAPGVAARIEHLVPASGDRDLRDAITRALDRMARSGVTSVLDPGRGGEFSRDLAAYRAVAGEAGLSARCTLMLRPIVGQPLVEYREEMAAPQPTEAHLSTGWVKLFADGDLNDGLLSWDYPGRPGYRGRAWASEDELIRDITVAVQAGWKVCVHALGDEAMRVVVSACERAAAAVGGFQPGTIGLAHVFYPRPDLVERCRRLGLVLFVQPSLIRAYGDEMIDKWGMEAAVRSNPLRSLLASDLEVGGGSDVYPPDALLGMATARKRVTMRGADLGSSQALTGEEALALYTVRAARSMGRPDLGRISVGARCDLAVFPLDPVEVTADQLELMSADITVVEGSIASGNIE